MKLALEEIIPNLRDAAARYRSERRGGSGGRSLHAQLQLGQSMDAVITLFDASQIEVLRLLERDPFVRWKKAVRKKPHS